MTISTRVGSARQRRSTDALQPTPRPARVLCDATARELDELLRCFRLAADACDSPIDISLQGGSRLFEFSSFYTKAIQRRSVSREASAAAVAGHRWLAALEFTQRLANHFRHRLQLLEPKSAQGERHAHEQRLEEATECWHQTILLAEIGELLSRVLGCCPSIHSWLSAVVLGAVEMSAIVDSLNPHVHFQTQSGPLQVTRLLMSLGNCRGLSLPSQFDKPRSPWNVLHAAQRLDKESEPMKLGTDLFAKVAPCAVPTDMRRILSRRLSVLRQNSRILSTSSWLFADTTQGAR